MGGIFFTLLTQPMYNALIWLYSVLPGNDLGVAIILLTVIIKLILWPFTGQSLKSQTAMQQLQPKIEEVKEKYKNDKEGQAKVMMALYKEEKVNPFSSCLPLLVQLPILLALYTVLRRSVTDPEMLQAPDLFPRRRLFTRCSSGWWIWQRAASRWRCWRAWCSTRR